MKLKKMKSINTIVFNLLAVIVAVFFISNNSLSENFFSEAKQEFDEKNYEDSKFLFQRNIVFNPKDAESYLFLAKIYKNEENEKEEIKNLNTTLLLDPKNEEAMHLLINYELKKSNYSKVKELKENLSSICKNICLKLKNIIFIIKFGKLLQLYCLSKRWV